MRPVLFHLGSVPVPTHSFFVVLGVAVGGCVFVAEARRRRLLDERMGWIVAGVLVGAVLGAHLATLWRYVERAQDPSLAGAFLDGGKSVLGGLSGAYVGALVAKRAVGYRASTGDLFAPAVAIGMAIGRWGCFLTEQIGTPTSLPWGIRLDAATAARVPNCPWCESGVAMHPSFLYEIAFHAAMFVVLLRWRARGRTDLFKLYLLAYAAFRFAVEFVRGNEIVWHGLTRSQLFLIPALAVLGAWFWRRPARERRGALAIGAEGG